MSTILEYKCGCRYYSDLKTIEALHLCTDHKIQVANDALKEFSVICLKALREMNQLMVGLNHE